MSVKMIVSMIKTSNHHPDGANSIFVRLRVKCYPARRFFVCLSPRTPLMLLRAALQNSPARKPPDLTLQLHIL